MDLESDQVIFTIEKEYPQAIIQKRFFCGETTLEVGKEYLKILLAHLKNNFEVLMDLTGVDYLFPIPHTRVVYWLHNPANLQRLRIFLSVERGVVIPTITDLWEGANWFERELYDLFGIQFEGHPSLKRILMPDNWNGHPLRRDYALTEEIVEFKNGVRPKVPSEIIHVDGKQKL